MSQKLERIKSVGFVDSSLKKAYADLESGKYEEQQLASFLKRAIQDLKESPFCGVRIPSKQWPKEYIKKYKINNLYKYDLPDGWRLLYTIRGNEIEIISVLIEWISHKDYERKFRYKRS
jgi:Txe/YoeB family toxin of Txe-Axe toxin-antitoxin module